jgi:hypothetical protein
MTPNMKVDFYALPGRHRRSMPLCGASLAVVGRKITPVADSAM